jgi:hypothetical protein
MSHHCYIFSPYIPSFCPPFSISVFPIFLLFLFLSLSLFSRYSCCFSFFISVFPIFLLFYFLHLCFPDILALFLSSSLFSRYSCSFSFFISVFPIFLLFFFLHLCFSRYSCSFSFFISVFPIFVLFSPPLYTTAYFVYLLFPLLYLPLFQFSQLPSSLFISHPLFFLTILRHSSFFFYTTWSIPK